MDVHVGQVLLLIQLAFVYKGIFVSFHHGGSPLNRDSGKYVLLLLAGTNLSKTQIMLQARYIPMCSSSTTGSPQMVRNVQVPSAPNTL